ncbi:MAG: thioredoxin family protein [Haloferacaceae archaeon]
MDPADQPLSSLEPDPEYDAEDRGDVLATLSAEGLTFKIWGGDWCGDCRARLPVLGAALSAAGVPPERVEVYPVEKDGRGNKIGRYTDEYAVDLIPTVVVERDGTELARFVETAEAPIDVALARQLSGE